jgi:protease-4
MTFKEKTKIRLVSVMMNTAASGGYYISLPSDFIIAHPTSIIGSVGVIFISPKAEILMEKIGLSMDVSKSGENKDMGSPFRKNTEEEQKIIHNMVEKLAQRFLSLVAKHRKIDQKSLSEISSARIYLSEEAQQSGLIDKVGYLDDAISKAKSLAGLSEDAKVIVYRQTQYPDDNLYNTSLAEYSNSLSLIDSGLLLSLISFEPGFYYLWMPACK